jgi:hypothetical protein
VLLAFDEEGGRSGLWNYPSATLSVAAQPIASGIWKGGKSILPTGGKRGRRPDCRRRTLGGGARVHGVRIHSLIDNEASHLAHRALIRGNGPDREFPKGSGAAMTKRMAIAVVTGLCLGLTVSTADAETGFLDRAVAIGATSHRYQV